MTKITQIKLTALAIFVLSFIASSTNQEGIPDRFRILSTVEYRFGQHIAFQGDLQPYVEIDSARIIHTIDGENLQIGILDIQPDGGFRYSLDLINNPMRAFSTLQYWFVVDFPNGEKFTSPTKSFVYEDNRFSWKKLEDGAISIHWYEGEQLFGKNLLIVSRDALNNIQRTLPLDIPNQIDVYTYASASAMRESLNLSTSAWANAGSDPFLPIALISIAPGSEERLQMEQQIPHELMHVALLNTLEKDYSKLPVWLIEGLATKAELYPNPDYIVLLEDAFNEDNLIPLEYLCTQFPQEGSQVFLAYAQSGSLVKFLFERYGVDSIQKLIQAFKQGADCEAGFNLALEKDLASIEKEWKLSTFGQMPLSGVIFDLLPWLGLFMLVLGIPITITIWSLVKKPSR